MAERTIAKDTYQVKVSKIRRRDFFLMCLAPLFIFNPEIAIMDILPDVIGYILLIIPLLKLRDTHERFEDAKKQLWIALGINVGKYVCLLLSFGALGQKEGGSASSLMMFSLVFAVLDIIFVCTAFRTFFDAMQKIGDKYGSDSICGRKKKIRDNVTYVARKNRTEKISRSTTTFIIVRALCYTIPEFSTGSSHAYDDTAFDWYKFTSLFRTLGVIVALIFGLVWLFKVTAYFVRVFKDKEFITALDENYRNTAQDHKVKFIIRKTASFVSFASVALFLCADMYLYDKSINILTDAIPAVLLIIMFTVTYSLFKTNLKLKIALILPTVLWFFTSIAKDVLRFLYFNKYTMRMFIRDPDAYSLYTAFNAVSIVDAVVFCAVIFSLCALINYINNDYAVSKLSIENESILKMKDVEKEEYRKSYVRPVRFFALVSAVCSALYPYVLTLTNTKVPDTADKYKSAEYLLVSFGNAYWFIDLAVTLLLAVLVRRALSALLERTENNLMLE